MRSLLFVLLCVLIIFPVHAQQRVPTEHADNMKAASAVFRKSVRQTLIDKCLRCHGGEKTRGGLDLTSRPRLLSGSDSGPVVDFNDPGSSLLLGVLRHEDEPTMPPDEPKLPDAFVDQLESWIKLGAAFNKPLIEKDDQPDAPMTVSDSDRAFWSFLPLRKPSVPAINDSWAITDIDRFVLHAMRKNGLEPNEPAERRTFVRRAYLDLLGMPPTPEQLEVALKQSRGELIDDLLANQHFGERWARHWLDAARFAESHGFEQDYDRQYAFHFRDFVIKAFNDNMPYDQFVRWQLAGDEIAPEDPLAMMATGFLGAGVFPTQLTEKEFESARYDELDDMAATMGTAMLGLTIGCARCHDHKFDPIPVKDYYQLLSTFSTTIRSEIDLNLNPESYKSALAKWEAKHAPIVKAKASYESDPSVVVAFNDWLPTAVEKLDQATPWTVLDVSDAVSSANAIQFKKQPDGSLLASGATPKSETYTFKASTSVRGIQFLRIEALAHDSFPKKGPGRAGNGNFALSDLKVFATRNYDNSSGKASKRVKVTLQDPRATHEQNKANLSVASAIDDDPSRTGWAVDAGGIGKDQAAVFRFSQPINRDDVGTTLLEFKLVFKNNGQHSMGRPRLSVSSLVEPSTVVGGGLSEAMVAAIDGLKANKLTSEHRKTLMPVFLAQDAKWVELDRAVAKSTSEKPKPNVTKVQVSSEGLPPTKHHADGRGFPHFYPQTHFLRRGDPNQKSGVASQGFLQVLMRNGKSTKDWQTAPPDDWRTSYRRHSLANWICDDQHGAGHLLARVIVNRVWHHHFGRGIVATPNDFGLQGEKPTHSELLDHLASELIADGWKLKPLHRKIMMSATYQQSSKPEAEKLSLDPSNQWLSRFSARRLEAEAIRDSMLSVSGTLDPTMFGKGTLSESHVRRSIYFMIKRSRLIPMMQIFDQPEPLVSQGSRPSTTIAPQALMFMNNANVVQWANHLAVSVDDPDFDRVIEQIYERAVCRPPTSEELADSREFLEHQRQSYQGKNARVQAIADLCQVVFSLNEFVYIQ